MMQRTLITFLLCAALTGINTSPVRGEEVSAQVRATLKEILKDQPAIIEVNRTPLEHLYEVVLRGRQILYVSPSARLIFAGSLYNEDKKNLTQERVAGLYSSLAVRIMNETDKSKGIKLGSGPMPLIEFADVDSPGCRKAEAFFQDKDSLFTRYVYFITNDREHHDARRKSLHIISSTDSAKEFKNAMAGKLDALSAGAFKSTPAAEEAYHYHTSLAESYDLYETPTFVWPEGFSQGADDKGLTQTAERLKKRMEKNK
jgi:thiol:disulfide interchange protein DsbC